MATNQDHTNDAGGVRYARIDSDKEQILDAPALDQGGQPKHHRVGGAQKKEIDQRQHISLRVLQHLQECPLCLTYDVLCIVLERILDQHLFFSREPGGLARFVLQQKVYKKPQDNRGQSLQQEQPLPAMKTSEAIKIFQN